MDKLWRLLDFNIRYFQRPPWDTGISPPELLEFIANHPPGRALDLGCGTGTNAIVLAQHAWQVTGVDFVRRAVAIARRKARLAGVNVDIRLDDVATLKDIAGPFELVLDIGCYHSLSTEDKQRYATNVPRLLSPDGTFLIYAFFKDLNAPGPGLVPADLGYLDANLVLEGRQDGSERGIHPSAWFTYRPRTKAANH